MTKYTYESQITLPAIERMIDNEIDRVTRSMQKFNPEIRAILKKEIDDLKILKASIKEIK